MRLSGKSPIATEVVNLRRKTRVTATQPIDFTHKGSSQAGLPAETFVSLPPNSTTPMSAFRGQLRHMEGGDLQPFPEAIAAFALWKSVPREGVRERLIVMPTAQGGWVWVAGLGGLERCVIEVHVLRQPLAAARAREILWWAALGAQGVKPAALDLWRACVQRMLPDDLLREFFPLGLTISALSRHFGFARATIRHHLKTRAQ